MNPYEKLAQEMTGEGLRVNESILRGKPVHGLYVEGEAIPPTALVNGALTECEKRCVLAEEAGHHFRSAGDILDQGSVQARKAENAGRRWAWEKLVPLEALALKKLEQPEIEPDEMAQQLDVTAAFLQDAMEHYRRTSPARLELPCGITVQFEPYFDAWITDEPHEEYCWFTRTGRRLSLRQADRLRRIACKLFAKGIDF